MPVWLLHSVSSSLLVQFPYGYSKTVMPRNSYGEYSRDNTCFEIEKSSIYIYVIEYCSTKLC